MHCHFPISCDESAGPTRAVTASVPMGHSALRAEPPPGRMLSTQGFFKRSRQGQWCGWVRRWLRPTCDVVGMWGGFTEAGIKTIVPAVAHAKVACRLVANQAPEAVLQAAQGYIEGLRLLGVTLGFRRLSFFAQPYDMPRDTPANRAAAEVRRVGGPVCSRVRCTRPPSERTYPNPTSDLTHKPYILAQVLEELLGTKPLFFRMGGSIPAVRPPARSPARRPRAGADPSPAADGPPPSRRPPCARCWASTPPALGLGSRATASTAPTRSARLFSVNARRPCLAQPLTPARGRRYQLSQMRLGGRAYVLLLHRLAEHARNDGAREEAAEAGVRTSGSDEL